MKVHVVCGVIWNQDRILVARKKEGKSNPLLWELPGGKIEAGESEEACLKRELSEELNLDVFVGPKLAEHEYKDHVKTINLIAFHASNHSGGDEGKFEFKLVDHDRIVWMEIWRLFSLQWAPADIPLIKMLVGSQISNPFELNP